MVWVRHASIWDTVRSVAVMVVGMLSQNAPPLASNECIVAGSATQALQAILNFCPAFEVSTADAWRALCDDHCASSGAVAFFTIRTWIPGFSATTTQSFSVSIVVPFLFL